MVQAREVVITGLGVVSPIGTGKDAFWTSLRDGRSGVGVRELFAETDLCYRIASEAKDFDPKAWVKPRKSLKVMCREIQMSYAAAMMAMEDAGLPTGSYDPDRLGVVVGAELFYCDNHEVADVYRNCIENGEFDYNKWGVRAMSDIFPLWMLKHLPNMASCHIGIALDARGPTNTITLEEISSLNSIIESFDVIRRGHADVMIAGGTGQRISLTSMVYRGEIDLSHRVHDPAGASRPFEKSRDGMVIGEGAGLFVLESREHAAARGAKILARMLGVGRSFEARSPNRTGSGICNSITGALRSAEIEAGDVGHVKAHGKSTVYEDAVEAQAIQATLGEVPVTAPTSFFGYLGAGSGAVEMVASVLALGHGEIPVTLNYDEPDPACPVNVVHGQPQPTDKPVAVVLSQAYMGQTAAIVLAGP